MFEPYTYCPRCASNLRVQTAGGLPRPVCASCGFTQWGNPTPVVAALIQYRDQILLARNAAWPPKMFALITGFLERDESPEEGVAREVHEETSLQVTELSLIGVYPFARKNELIIAYHAKAEGEIALSEELAEYRLFEPHKLRPWRLGTGLAMADWMRARGYPVEFFDLPPKPSST